MIWLVAVLVVGALAWITFGVVVGLIAAGAMLALSEVIERRARRKRRAAAPDR
jgi:uncharacterized protein involved in cysteine biosynthesis